MTEKLLQLRTPEVWRALAAIDPVAVLAEELIGRTIARAGHEHRSIGRLVPWPARPAAGALTDPVVLEYPQETPVCVASAMSLRMARAATLAALAARELLIPGGVTVAMLGLTGPVQPQLALIARHVPDISHVALWAPGIEGGEKGIERLDPEFVDQLDLSGIGLSVASSSAEAVFGANLVIAAGGGTHQEDLDHLEFGHLARGTVLVNATGHNLPDASVGDVDRVFVDDLGLLTAHRDRHVVATHLAKSTAGNDSGGGRDQRIVSDLAQLLIGKYTYRQADDVVLVELLGVEELNVDFAYRIYQAARQHGLGTQILTNGG